MRRDLILSLYLVTGIILAVLLLTHLITPVAGGIIFALALVNFGGLSKGFHKDS